MIRVRDVGSSAAVPWEGSPAAGMISRADTRFLGCTFKTGSVWGAGVVSAEFTAAFSVSLKKSINASQACIDQIKNNSLYSLAGAEYTISLNGKVVETIKTDAKV